MNYTFRDNKIKRFLKLIDGLDETMVNSKLWKFSRTGLGEIGQGNLFYILNSINRFNEINFPRLIKSIITFFLVILIFPIKYIFYRFKCFMNINNSLNYSKAIENLNIFVAPVDNKNNLKGSHEKIFMNLQKRNPNLVLIPLKPLIFKNVFSFSNSNKNIINLTDIFLEKPRIFFSWIGEIIYIFKTLLKINKKKLEGINKLFIILSFIESSLRETYEIYGLINLLIYKLNECNATFYTTFEANTFEKVLVNFRSNRSRYESFHVCAITDYLTKHYFYSRLIKEKGFPNIIYTPSSVFYNSSIFKYYSNISKIIEKINIFDKSKLIKVEDFRYKFALLCSGGFDSNYLVDFIKQIIKYKICNHDDIIVSLHPSVKITNYSLRVIKNLGLETTKNLNKSITNSQIGIYVSSSSSINAIDGNMPLKKVNSMNIFDCNNPLESINENNNNLVKFDFEFNKTDAKIINRFLLDKKIQYRKKSSGWFYG